MARPQQTPPNWTIRVPEKADPETQQAIRDIQQVFNFLFSGNVSMQGRRVSGAGEAVDLDDYVTLRQLRNLVIQGVAGEGPLGAIGAGTSTTPAADSGGLRIDEFERPSRF